MDVTRDHSPPDVAERARRLGALDCCAVSDALDRLGLPGVVTGVPRRSGRGRIAGRVQTVQLGVGTPDAVVARHLCTAAIEAAVPGDVIVVEQRSGIEAAGWGGILSLGAKLRGVAGAIIEGPARDIDESEQEVAEQITAREAAMAEALQAGQTITTVMGADYEQMLKPGTISRPRR